MVLIARRNAFGVAEMRVRSLIAGSPETRATSSAGTAPVATAAASSPVSAMTRLVCAVWSAPKDQTKRSGYWWRTGSVFGSQCSLRSRTNSTPGVCLVILYGPEEKGLLSRFTPVSFAGGSGAVAGSEAAKGRSQRGWSNSKRSVFASGALSPGGSASGFSANCQAVSNWAVPASHSCR